MYNNPEAAKELTHNESSIILQKYMRHKVHYQTLNKARKIYLEMLFGMYSKRVHLFPSFVERLRGKGHHVEYGCVDAAKMREYTIASAENLHRLRFKGEKGAPEFDKSAVDLRGIKDGSRCIAW